MPEPNFTHLIQKQQAYFLTGETKNIQFRLKQLKMLREVVVQNENLIFESLQKDLHKSEFESYAVEIGSVLEELSYHIKHLKKWAKAKRVKNPLVNFPASSYQTYEPKGNVLIISPWNLPFQLAFAPLIGAISAGNTVVIKPSEISIETAGVIKKIINKAFDSKYIEVIIGDAKEARELLKLDFNHIFFTGSERVGRIILETAAPKLIPVTLELGGKSPCIVDEKVNVRQTARRIIWGKLINTGQTCIAPDYLLVHDKIKDKLLPELVNAIKQFYGDNPKESAEYPRIINRANMERLVAMLEGADIYWGGGYDIENLYFEPAILNNITFDMASMQSEIFGPILPVITYSSIDKLISMLRMRPNPLALYFFSNNKKHIRKILDSVPAGGVTINDTMIQYVNNKLPFGGTGSSGIGKYHGKYSFEVFSNQKPVVYKATWIDIPIRYAPFKNKIKYIRKLMK